MRSIYVCALSASIMLLAGSSCKKAYDYVRTHPDDHISFCRVTMIRQPTGFFNAGQPDTLDVLYNAKGDPTDILERVSPPAYIFNNQDQHWRYDRYGNLILYYITFPPPAGTPTGAFTTHKYAYPRPNFVTDTIINYAPSFPFPPNYKDNIGSSSIQGYALDVKGRIAKIYTLSADPHQPPHFESDVLYDANGNKVLDVPGFTYDHMLNPYRTNYVFQFTFNDFSLNNRMAADPNSVGGLLPTYNQFGLPLSMPFVFGMPAPFGIIPSFVTYYDYACSMPKGPIDY